MKTNLTKNVFKSVLAGIFISAIVQTVMAQTSLTNENFDGVPLALPSGWTATTNGWKVDSSNVSSGYAGASGLQNLAIKNSFPSGTYAVMTTPVSTMGYSSITVLWGARHTVNFPTPGSSISAFDWSSDGGNTWIPIPYSNNAPNSIWGLVNGGTRIPLPAGASGQTSLMFRWIAIIVTDPNGTYRIDDFNIMGISASGINTVLTPSAHLNGMFEGSILKLNLQNFSSEKVSVNIYSTDGKLISSTKEIAGLLNIELPGINSGLYLVEAISESERRFVKVVK